MASSSFEFMNEIKAGLKEKFDIDGIKVCNYFLGMEIAKH